MKQNPSIPYAEGLEKLTDLEFLANEHSLVISGLLSLEYTMKRFIDKIEGDCTVADFLYHLENTRSSYFFQYTFLERIMAETFPMYMTRIKRIGMQLDEGFEQMFRRYFQDRREIVPEQQLRSAHESLVVLIQELYDRFEGLNYLHPNPYRKHI